MGPACLGQNPQITRRVSSPPSTDAYDLFPRLFSSGLHNQRHAICMLSSVCGWAQFHLRLLQDSRAVPHCCVCLFVEVWAQPSGLPDEPGPRPCENQRALLSVCNTVGFSVFEGHPPHTRSSQQGHPNRSCKASPCVSGRTLLGVDAFILVNSSAQSEPQPPPWGPAGKQDFARSTFCGVQAVVPGAKQTANRAHELERFA